MNCAQLEQTTTTTTNPIHFDNCYELEVFKLLSKNIYIFTVSHSYVKLMW